MKSNPESKCEECGRDNVTWFTPNPIWNAVVRLCEKSDPILCPVCFITMAEKAGYDSASWKIMPEGYPEGTPNHDLV